MLQARPAETATRLKTRRVEFQGTVHEFPGSATDDQVRAALTSHAGGTSENRSVGGFLENTVNSAGRFAGDVAGVAIQA